MEPVLAVAFLDEVVVEAQPVELEVVRELEPMYLPPGDHRDRAGLDGDGLVVDAVAAVPAEKPEHLLEIVTVGGVNPPTRDPESRVVPDEDRQ